MIPPCPCCRDGEHSFDLDATEICGHFIDANSQYDTAELCVGCASYRLTGHTVDLDVAVTDYFRADAASKSFVLTNFVADLDIKENVSLDEGVLVLTTEFWSLTEMKQLAEDARGSNWAVGDIYFDEAEGFQKMRVTIPDVGN